MRMSANPRDPAFSADARDFEVLVDGQLWPGCIDIADTEGEILSVLSSYDAKMIFTRVTSTFGPRGRVSLRRWRP